MSKHPPEIILDDGRLIMRRLENGRWVGLRLPSLDTVHGRMPNVLIRQHNIRETTERVVASGVRQYAWGTDRQTAAEKRRKLENAQLAREWLTRRWG